MWAEYGEKGSGFAIIFDGKRLSAGSHGGSAYGLAPVIYDEGIQYDKTTRVIDRAIQIQHKWNLRADEVKRYWSEEVPFALLVCGLRFKAPRYQHEQEVRIAVAENESLKPFTHAGKRRVALPFERPAVIRIVCGPEHAGTDTTERVRILLNCAGYESNLPIL